MMTSFSQRDPQWGDLCITGTMLKIKDYGCLLCCIADLSTYFGEGFDPIGALRRCSFTPEGELIWAVNSLEDFEFVELIKGRNDDMIKQYLDDPDTAVILGLYGGRHWVVACSYFPNTNLYRIADPYNGDKCEIDRYGNQISYMAFYKRKRK